MTLRVLVFPCGSEVGLEISAALEGSRHFEVVGASSVSDHGEFALSEVFAMPTIHEDGFAAALAGLVIKERIDVLYPAMDSVALAIAKIRDQLACRVALPGSDVVRACSSKRATYELLRGAVAVPREYSAVEEIDAYPAFLKPDDGHGGRDTLLAADAVAAQGHLHRFRDQLILEFLPGEEYTVDCFTDRRGNLRYVAARRRDRVRHGISMRAALLDADADQEFRSFAEGIATVLAMRGAWFFQVKRNRDGALVLLEVACRPAGSSAINRFHGVNLPMLTLFDQMEVDLEITADRSYGAAADRSLRTRIKHDFSYQHLYVDLDDCLIMNGKVNHGMVALIFKAVNHGAKIHLITRCKGDLPEILVRHRLQGLFDEIHHLTDESKSNFIHANSLFVDDSHVERRDARGGERVLSLSPDCLDFLL